MTDDQEIKIVTREETFTDLAVRELAKTKAMCACRLQFARCPKSKCKHCETNIRYTNCVKSMSDYDVTRLNNYIRRYYRMYSRNNTAWLSHKNYKKFYLKLVLLIFFILAVALLPLCFFTAPSDKPLSGPRSITREELYNYNKDYVEAITDYVMNAQNLVEIYNLDINKDGKINCIDYTLAFKIVWDTESVPYEDYKGPGSLKYYKSALKDCIIVRNYNVHTGMNHLFIAVFLEDLKGYVFIEPWASDCRYFFMYENWDSSKYNPEYNTYNETEQWVKEIR